MQQLVKQRRAVGEDDDGGKKRREKRNLTSTERANGKKELIAFIHNYFL
jgi:hypothetical protein